MKDEEKCAGLVGVVLMDRWNVGQKFLSRGDKIAEKAHRILENQSDEIFESVEASVWRTLDFICEMQGRGIITFVI